MYKYTHLINSKTPSIINTETHTKKHSNETDKNQDKKLESSKREVTHHIQVIFNKIKLTANFSSEITEARKQ